MRRQLRHSLTVSLALLFVAHRTSAQLVSSVSSSGSHSFSSSSAPAVSTRSSTSVAAVLPGRYGASEPSLSLPAWALAVLTVGGLVVFLATLKLASCFYWMTEKQRAERGGEEGVEDGRSGGVAPMAAVTVVDTNDVHAAPSTANTAAVVRSEQARKAVPTHISLTQQGGRAAGGDETSEVSRWDSSEASDELYTEGDAATTHETGADEGVSHNGEVIVIVTGVSE